MDEKQTQQKPQNCKLQTCTFNVQSKSEYLSFAFPCSPSSPMEYNTSGTEYVRYALIIDDETSTRNNGIAIK